MITKLVAEEGETLPVGAVIALIDESGRRAQQAKPAAPAPLPEPPAPQRRRSAATLRRSSAAPSHTGRRRRRVIGSGGGGSEAPAAASPRGGASAARDEHRRYSPVVLRMAAEHGLDIAQIPGTGIGGRVSKRDVESYLESLRGGEHLRRASPAQPQPSHARSAAPSAPTTASGPGAALPRAAPTTTGRFSSRRFISRARATSSSLSRVGASSSRSTWSTRRPTHRMSGRSPRSI